MEIKSVYAETEDRMQKTVDAIGREFAGIRTGKATPSLVEGIKVDYYGNMTALSQVASITVPDPKLLVIQPWEKRLIPEIAKAIQKSDLGLNPLTDANVVRLPIPPLTEERRRDLVKLVKKISEEGKIAVRNIRRESNDRFKKAEKEKEISEDNSRKAQERIQEITDDFIQAIDDLVKKKEEEIMEI